jgi:hypothetical protein
VAIAVGQDLAHAEIRPASGAAAVAAHGSRHLDTLEVGIRVEIAVLVQEAER